MLEEMEAVELSASLPTAESPSVSSSGSSCSSQCPPVSAPVRTGSTLTGSAGGDDAAVAAAAGDPGPEDGRLAAADFDGTGDPAGDVAFVFTGVLLMAGNRAFKR